MPSARLSASWSRGSFSFSPSGARCHAQCAPPAAPARRAHGLGFFAAWLTTELAPVPHALAVVGRGRVRLLGALDVVAGLARPRAHVVSWVGLASSVRGRARSRRMSFDDALARGARPRLTPTSTRALGAAGSVDVVAASCARSSSAARRAADPQHPVRRRRRRRHRLDIYRPRERRPQGAPVLLQIHGGGWMIGEQGPAGPAAHVPPRRTGLGLRRDQLPALAARRRGPTISSTASARWRGCASTSPSTAATPTSSSSPAARPAGISPR